MMRIEDIVRAVPGEGAKHRGDAQVLPGRARDRLVVGGQVVEGQSDCSEGADAGETGAAVTALDVDAHARSVVVKCVGTVAIETGADPQALVGAPPVRQG